MLSSWISHFLDFPSTNLPHLYLSDKPQCVDNVAVFHCAQSFRGWKRQRSAEQLLMFLVSAFLVCIFLKHSAFQSPPPLSGRHSLDLNYSLTQECTVVFNLMSQHKCHWGLGCRSSTFKVFLYLLSSVQPLSLCGLEEEKWGLLPHFLVSLEV